MGQATSANKPQGATGESLERQLAVYEYWYKPLEESGFAAEGYKKSAKVWFGIDETGKPVSKEEKQRVDDEITHKFKGDIEKLAAGDYDDWAETAKGVTAVCVLGDQMTRNVYRGTAEAFSLDPKVLSIVLKALDSGKDMDLPFIVRSFWYMPLMHSEDVALHERMLDFYRKQRDALPAGWQKDAAANNVKFGEQHTEVVKRFGRYPHRNAALGRESTPEEIEYLKSSDSWGQ